MKALHAAFGAAGLLLAACGQPLGPDRGDPAQYLLSVPPSYAGCGSPNVAWPSQELGVFDIYFDSRVTPPRSDRVHRVVAAGGTILKRFQVNGVRAILPLRQISRLPAASINSVHDLAVTEHLVEVGFTVTGKGGLIAAQGGRVLWLAQTIPDFVAVIPDAGIPAILADADLRYFAVSVSCGATVN